MHNALKNIVVKEQSIELDSIGCMEEQMKLKEKSKCFSVASCGMVYLRPKVVYGNLASPVLFVGLNPHLVDPSTVTSASADSNKQPRFFSYHKRLMQILSKKYYPQLFPQLDHEHDAMHSEIVQCGTPGEEQVSQDAKDTCGTKYLVPVIQATHPRVVVALGRFASGWLCGKLGVFDQFHDKIRSEHGNLLHGTLCGQPVSLVISRHPADRIRNEDLEKVAASIAECCSAEDFVYAREHSILI